MRVPFSLSPIPTALLLAGLMTATASPARAQPVPQGIALGGVTVPRTSPPPTPLDDFQRAEFQAQLDAVLTLPPGFGLFDWRSEEAALEAVDAPLVANGSGAAASFGQLAIIRPQHFNLTPSPAFIFRVALHAGTTVIMNRTVLPAGQNGVRPVTEIAGVPVPDALLGKIFEVGPDDLSMLGITQGSDNFLEELEELHEAQGVLGFDALHARATFIGHGDSALEGIVDRDRLGRMGFSDAIGALVCIEAGIRWPNNRIPVLFRVGKYYESKISADMKLSFDLYTVEAFDRLFGHGQEQLVDLSVAAVLGPPVTLSFDPLSFPPVRLEHVNNIRPVIRLVAGVQQHAVGESDPEVLQEIVDVVTARLLSAPIDFLLGGEVLPGDYTSNGPVPLEMAMLGRQSLVLEEPHDHAGIWEDPAVVDSILQALNP